VNDLEAALKQSPNPNLRSTRYGAQHALNERSARPGVYDPASAKLAWDRTLSSWTSPLPDPESLTRIRRPAFGVRRLAAAFLPSYPHYT